MAEIFYQLFFEEYHYHYPLLLFQSYPLIFFVLTVTVGSYPLR